MLPPQTGAYFTNCVNKGTVGSSGTSVGGFGGSNSDKCHYYNCSNEGVVKAGYGQFGSSVGSVGGTNTGRTDALAIHGTPSAANDGIWYATVAGDVATYVKTNQLVKNTSYLVTAKIPAAQFELAADGDTITFDYTLYSPASWRSSRLGQPRKVRQTSRPKRP